VVSFSSFDDGDRLDMIPNLDQSERQKDAHPQRCGYERREVSSNRSRKRMQIDLHVGRDMERASHDDTSMSRPMPAASFDSAYVWLGDKTPNRESPESNGK